MDATAVARRHDGITVKATSTVHFDDFGLRIPRLFFIVSVEDTVRLAADLTLRRL
jgi:hypothetical protein